MSIKSYSQGPQFIIVITINSHKPQKIKIAEHESQEQD